MSQLSSSTLSQNDPVVVGIDWADREHDVCIIDGQQRKPQTLKQDPEAIAEWLEQLQKKYPQRVILLAIEQSRGALVHALQEAEGLEIYPINPKQLARYREAVYPAGGKSDPRDSELLARFLLLHREKLRPWQPDTLETRQLAYLSQLRRKLVDERKTLGLRLVSFLKLYFPLVLSLFGRTPTSEFVIDLLRRCPSLEQLKRLHPKTLRQFFQEHRVCNEDRQTKWIQAIRSATPLVRDKAIISTHAPYVQSIVEQIAVLNRSVAQFEEQIRLIVAQHPDDALFRSLPGAADALVPRLIGAFGSDRDRYQVATEVQACVGIAPVTKRSGNSCSVLQRFFCPTFHKQTFHEFADQARRHSAWSKAFYDLKRSQGMKHQAAVRALAYKWIRIIFRLWKTNTVYSEEHYIQHLRQKQSPLIAFLDKT